MSILDTTIVNVALHTLAHDLHSPIAQVQWVITGYLLALAAVIPVTGWAARRFGAKRVYLVSLVLFTAGSALCAVAELAHLAGALPRAAGRRRRDDHAGRAADHGPGRRSPADGPGDGLRRRCPRCSRRSSARSSAALILQNLHWSWIFLVNVPIGVIAFVLGWRMLPRTDSGEAGRLDVLGLALLSDGCRGDRLRPLEARLAAPPGRSAEVILPIARWDRADRASSACTRCASSVRCSTSACTPTACSPAASFTTFGLGAALFGAMILVPLYYQEVRGRERHRDRPAHRPAGDRHAARDAAR